MSRGRPRRPRDPLPDVSGVQIVRLGEKLRMLRSRRGWTQQDIANALERASQGNISDFERGTDLPTVLQALALAELLNVSLDYLLRDEEMDSGPYHTPSDAPHAPDDRRYAEHDGE